MQQDTETTYIVAPGEEVTVEIQALQIADTAILTIPSVALQEVSTTPRVYRFTINQGAGHTIFGMVTCDFSSTGNNGASFQVFVSGSGNERFPGRLTRKTDPEAERPFNLNFEVE